MSYLYDLNNALESLQAAQAGAGPYELQKLSSIIEEVFGLIEEEEALERREKQEARS